MRWGRRRKPPTFTLAQRSRLDADLRQILDHPYGTVVEIVLTELEAAGFMRQEAGFFGGVAPAPRARELDGFELRQIQEKPARDAEAWERHLP